LSAADTARYNRIKVTEVIDGDTVRLENGKLLRYIGIDTPETRLKKNGLFVLDPQPFSQEAKEYNRLLVENKYIRIEFDTEKTDRYKRLLGYCFIDNIFVNAALVKEGFAVLYTRPPNLKYTNLFLSSQRQAQKDKKGLWGAYETIDHSQANNYINQIRTVTGRVISTYKSKKCIFLNFGTNYKTDFTIVIFKRSFSHFYNQEIDPVEFYRGKFVEVSGRIREHNGPEIIVNVPEEIIVTD